MSIGGEDAEHLASVDFTDEEMVKKYKEKSEKLSKVIERYEDMLCVPGTTVERCSLCKFLFEKEHVYSCVNINNCDNAICKECVPSYEDLVKIPGVFWCTEHGFICKRCEVNYTCDLCNIDLCPKCTGRWSEDRETWFCNGCYQNILIKKQKTEKIK